MAQQIGAGEEDEARDQFDDWDLMEAETAAWQERFNECLDGGNLRGLPRGLRLRQAAKSDVEAPERPPQLVPARRWELILLALLCVVTAACCLHVLWRHLLWSPPDWREGCQQCQPRWWQDFWRWRLHQLHHGNMDNAPEGMTWEWGDAQNNTDWYEASTEFVQELVRPFADPSLGPVLHVGCGDAPVPEQLQRAGFERSEHIDVEPQVIQVMLKRYPLEQWPGFKFLVRDFLEQGAPPPLGRFCAVLDKAGIWDWLQEEAPQLLPRLLQRVDEALAESPEAVYIIATKLTPPQLSELLGRLPQLAFHVETSSQLGDVAWGYVLQRSQ